MSLMAKISVCRPKLPYSCSFGSLTQLAHPRPQPQNHPFLATQPFCQWPNFWTIMNLKFSQRHSIELVFLLIFDVLLVSTPFLNLVFYNPLLFFYGKNRKIPTSKKLLVFIFTYTCQTSRKSVQKYRRLLIQ